MIFVFKQIYNTIFLKNTMNVITGNVDDVSN